MKTIYLIRHANSAWKENETDINRSLSDKGKEEAKVLFEKLKLKNFNPDKILCSTAKRTQETAAILCQIVNYHFTKVEIDASIYEATLTDLTQIVNELNNEFNTIALIGHNPAITDFTNYLTNNNIGNMPTCSVIKITLDISNWNEIVCGVGIEEFYMYPH